MAPSVLGETCPDPVIPTPKPEFEIDINDDCEIIVTKLDWKGLKDDHDNSSTTPHSALTPANNFRISIYEKTIGRELDYGKFRQSLSSTTPHTYFEFTGSGSSPPNLQSLLASGDLRTGVDYEVRLNGFYVGLQGKNFDVSRSYLAKRTPRGEGVFRITAFNGGNYRINLDNDDSRPRPINTANGCLDGAHIPFVNIDINDACDIIIRNIGWQSNDTHIHNLQLEFAPKSEVSEEQSSTPQTLYSYISGSNPFAGQLNAGTL